MQANPRHIGAKTTDAPVFTDTEFYDIPVVVHVVHNNGSEILSDNAIYGLIKEMNDFYSAKNDTSSVIQPFKKYVGKGRIRFHLATMDPNGKPTNGITHSRSYLTYGFDDQAKYDQWPPNSYYNIWFENVIGRAVTGGTVLAYATFPASSAAYPYYDGVIAGYLWINDGGSDGGCTLDHETGHYLNLAHTWNNSGKGAGEACGDDDVDDTPPTKGHFSTCPLYDTACAQNYFKLYSDIHGHDSLLNYPDTTNVQNVMDYSSCTNMFTHLQVERMHAALNSNVAYRNNLWDSLNLAITGIGTYSPSHHNFTAKARPDLKPNPEFAALNTTGITSIGPKTYQDKLSYFNFPNTNVMFRNESWNDTVTAVKWEFSNGATIPTVSYTTSATINTIVTNKFTDPGWVDIKLTATGNNSGDTTAEWNHSVFVADAAGTSGVNYYQEFTGADTAKWPTFNYYNNGFKWQHANVGYYDHDCMMYTGYDPRYNPFSGAFPPYGCPRGDFDDMFSVPVDLSSGFAGNCSLNFYYAGASSAAATLTISLTPVHRLLCEQGRMDTTYCYGKIYTRQ